MTSIAEISTQGKEEYVVYALRLTYDLSYEYRYVGLTKNLYQRLACHKHFSINPNGRSSHLPLYSWMRKHFNAVSVDILEVCSSHEEMIMAEVKWIHVLRTRGYRLLNVTEGGEGAAGVTWTEERREAHRQRLTGEGNPMFGVDRSGEKAPNFGKATSEETKAKLRAYRLSAQDHWRGSKHTEDTKKKMSEKRTAYWTEEQKAEMSRKMSGRKTKAGHTRYHTNRGVVKEGCGYCV